MELNKPILTGAGICLHVTSLPGDYGIGELGNGAKRFILGLEAMGLSVWQILPTGPTGYADSPYQPHSTFAGNELLIDIYDLYKAGWLNIDEIEPLRKLPLSHVDYGQLIPLKMDLLTLAAGRFLQSAQGEQIAAYEAYVLAHDSDWLHDYANYRVLKQRFDQRAWVEWPDEFRLRDAAALKNLNATAGDAIAAFKVLQFWFQQQWTGLQSFARKHGVSILGDMPFYIAYDSADAWACPTLLQLDDELQPVQVAGVPPDYFSDDGQLWGNPVYDWETHAQENYAWWCRRVQHALEQTDALRLDHFRGFEAFWSIPADAATARDGEWIEGPGAALFAALEAQVGKLPLVAEDLGVITPKVDALREQFNLPGMTVLQFELVKPDFDPLQIADDRVCYTGTHDNDTVRGWLEGDNPGERDAEEVTRTRTTVLDRIGGDLDDAHLRIFELALGTSAACVITPMQDLLGLGSSARLNTPGTTESNWQWRLAQDLSEVSEIVIELLRATQRLSRSRDL
jgi:4-alpha-glucanotransferase